MFSTEEIRDIVAAAEERGVDPKDLVRQAVLADLVR